jgi:hypothetical protein
VILILSSFSAFATVYHSDGSAINVQLIHDIQAIDGDTITIPPGSFTWTTTVTISKGITLQGAGLSASHIIDQGSGGAALRVTCSAAHFVRVTGLEFIKSTAHPSGMVQFGGGSSGGRNEVGFRFDNCKLNFPTTGGRGVYSVGIFGLIDHNSIVVSGPGSQQSISVDGSSINTDGGFTPWTRPLTLGTDKAVSIEDNTFDYTGNDQAEDSIDAYSGARVVVRHNTFLSISQGFHGTDSGSNRSPHSFEIYNNTYINNSSHTIRALTVRGGTGVIWGNTYGGSHGSWYGVTLQYFRATAPGSAWRQCDGTVWQLGSTDVSTEASRTCSVNGGVGFNNVDKETLGPWGGNYTRGFDGTGLHGYPGRDQPGFTTGQVSSPIYIWNQSPDFGAGPWAGGNPADQALLATFIVEGRDYFRNTPRPGYTPYVYPHPLVTGTGTPTPTPTGTPTPMPSATPTPSASPSSTATPTSTPTATATSTPPSTPTPPPPTPTPTATTTPTPSAATTDFNGDGHPDWVLRHAVTGQTAIWYLNNNVYVSSAYGPTLAAGWGLRALGDFNHDSHPDYGLFALNTDQTAIWYLSGPSYIGGAYAPTLPSGWELVATADFNGDSKPDYVLYNSGTNQTAIWYMNNNVYAGGGYGPTLPPGWTVVGAADFDRDGHPDYLLYHPSSGYTAIGYLSGLTLVGAAWGPILPSGWTLVATTDFNGDGNPDYTLYETDTRQTAIWYLNNNVYTGSAWGPTLPAGWSLTAP